MPWEQCEIVWGDTSKHLPRSSVQAGSQTTHAHTRANHAAAQDALRKLRAIAARDLGGSPSEYAVADGRVYRRSNPSRGMSFTRAAERLHVTQGAVSRQIKQLEEELGQPLFHRRGRKLKLTEAGQ